jgi:vacuolar-type H+-ATPase subunit F/Vma7
LLGFGLGLRGIVTTVPRSREWPHALRWTTWGQKSRKTIPIDKPTQQRSGMAKKGQKIRPRPEGYLLAIIADEVCLLCFRFFADVAKDTCTGFMLAGTGCVDANRKANFLVVDPSMHTRTLRCGASSHLCAVRQETTKAQIKQAFEEFTTREDIGVLLISQEVLSLFCSFAFAVNSSHPVGG